MISYGMTDYHLGEYACEEVLKGNIPETSDPKTLLVGQPRYRVICDTSYDFWDGFREKFLISIEKNKELKDAG